VSKKGKNVVASTRVFWVERGELGGWEGIEIGVWISSKKSGSTT